MSITNIKIVKIKNLKIVKVKKTAEYSEIFMKIYHF